GLLAGSGAVDLAVALSFLVGMQLMLRSHGANIGRSVSVENLATAAFVRMARRIGTATDLNAVADAVLAACREHFNQTTRGRVLCFDDESGTLRPLASEFGGGQSGTGPISLEFLPHEGLTG